MVADVRLEEHDLDVQVYPIVELHAEFQRALADEGQEFGMALVLRNLPHQDAVAACGRAFARVLIESSSVDRSPEEWGEWFRAHPDAYYMLLEVADNHERWREWAGGD